MISGLVIRPFESLAKDIFGVMNMPEIVEVADREGMSFLAVRDIVWNEQIPEPAREEFRALARAFTREP